MVCRWNSKKEFQNARISVVRFSICLGESLSIRISFSCRFLLYGSWFAKFCKKRAVWLSLLKPTIGGRETQPRNQAKWFSLKMKKSWQIRSFQRSYWRTKIVENFIRAGKIGINLQSAFCHTKLDWYHWVTSRGCLRPDSLQVDALPMKIKSSALEILQSGRWTHVTCWRNLGFWDTKEIDKQRYCPILGD